MPKSLMGLADATCMEPTTSHSDSFDDAIRLFYDKVSAAKYNMSKLHSLRTPIARINATHLDHAAASVTPDDAGRGLHPVVFLANQALHKRTLAAYHSYSSSTLSEKTWPTISLPSASVKFPCHPWSMPKASC